MQSMLQSAASIFFAASRDINRGIAMLRVCARLFFVALLVALSTASVRTMEVPQAMVRLPGHVLPALAKATVVPSKPGSDAQPMTLTIVLKRDDQVGFELFPRALRPSLKELPSFSDAAADRGPLRPFARRLQFDPGLPPHEWLRARPGFRESLDAYRQRHTSEN
jgi:hypothetical protein